MLPSIFGENLFDEFFGHPFDEYMKDTPRVTYGKHGGGLMKTDVRETADAYEIDIDLPGFEKDAVTVDLRNGYLTVNATKNQNTEETDKNGRYIRRERYAGSCTRSFYVGDVHSDEIQAKYEAGVLRLTVPKTDMRRMSRSTQIAIE